MPVTEAANLLSLSTPETPFTVNTALWVRGQYSGAAPVTDAGLPKGIQGQLSCGAKATVMEQDAPEAREKVAPGEEAQVSCSVKLGTPLKSLCPLNDVPMLLVKLK